MKCRHCLVEFFPVIKEFELRGECDPIGLWVIK